MDLNDALPDMSWRRFIVLVNGLGPWSVWQNEISRDSNKPRVITDADEGDRYTQSIFR